jgi:thiamine biosynthesis lipoprotein
VTTVFRAMGTEVAVTALDADEAIVSGELAAIFREAEQRFSRFLETSELSALNRATGPVVVSAPMFDALERARSYVRATSGIFDPGVGATLAALGYDRSFAPGALDRDAIATARPATFLDVRLDRRSRVVHRPAHVLVDLGGMIKGATVDAAARALGGAGAVDAGGDAVVRGRPWVVEVEDPRDPSRVVATLSLANAAVATSAPNRRRWRAGGRVVHHVIDPRTQEPAESDLLQATLVAPTAELADVAAKTVLVLGAREGRRFVEGAALGAVLVRRDGRVAFVGRVCPMEAA